MSREICKLSLSITESTVWQEDPHTRLVWITMLVMADDQGRVRGSIPGLAARARVPLKDTQLALEKFLAPDPFSRTQDYDGRRIEVMDGGWRLLNFDKYQKIGSVEAIKESKRKYINNRRAMDKLDAKADTKPARKAFAPPLPSEAEFYGTKIGLPPAEVQKFMNYYECKGWMVGRSPMRSWEAAMRNWKINWEQRRLTVPPAVRKPLGYQP